ncbi:hypothetical protein RR48_14044 [Papilio machaon]|uniref:Uncharacterized protein n=1 Tax=Papilio machaon TaxID=76193 RepID=A0A194QMW0_PAPMA|nr:hypothetical protein RR48_14044 [Papilio machaon]
MLIPFAFRNSYDRAPPAVTESCTRTQNNSVLENHVYVKKTTVKTIEVGKAVTPLADWGLGCHRWLLLIRCHPLHDTLPDAAVLRQPGVRICPSGLTTAQIIT